MLSRSISNKAKTMAVNERFDLSKKSLFCITAKWEVATAMNRFFVTDFSTE